jgi:hypothetical protein
MQQNLAKYHGKKITVEGYFDRFLTLNFQGKLVTSALFRSLRLPDTGELLADYCHVNNAHKLKGRDLDRGECVRFDVVVLDYLKTDHKSGLKKEEYGLYHPTQIRLVDREPAETTGAFGAGVFDD